MARAVDVIGDRWPLLIVRDAFDGITRFSEFPRNLGLAKNTLSSRLRELVAHDILDVVPDADEKPLRRLEVKDAAGRVLNSTEAFVRKIGTGS